MHVIKPSYLLSGPYLRTVTKMASVSTHGMIKSVACVACLGLALKFMKNKFAHSKSTAYLTNYHTHVYVTLLAMLTL